MSHKVIITVDGKTLEVDPTQKLIVELIKNGISVPHFCYHEALGVDGNCRMCMVEIQGQKRPQIACNTPIKEGMEVFTQSEMIQKVKRDILELELINHPVDCPICDQAGECSLQEYYMEVGLHHSRVDIAHKVKKAKHVDLGGNVILDQERCVLCARCTRFTANVTKTHDLVIANRGNHACVTTFGDQKLHANGYAMNVVDLCPVGALTSKDFRFRQRVWFLQSDASVCHGCATGCNIYIDHNAPKYEDDTIYRFRPRKNEQVNGHFICDHGRLSYKELNENRFFNTDEGNTATLEKIKELLYRKKGRSFGVVSPSLSLENMAAIIQFAKTWQIPLYAGEESTLDEAFKDTLLKSSDRSSNRNGSKLLGIKQQTLKEDALLEGSLVINFDNQDYIEAQNSDTLQWLHFTAHKQQNNCINFPMAAFSEQEGSIINCNNRLQKFHSTIRHPLGAPPLYQTLGLLCEEEALQARDTLWSFIRTVCPALSEIYDEKIPPEGIIIEERP